jgi:hypothetical protein
MKYNNIEISIKRNENNIEMKINNNNVISISAKKIMA